MNAPDGPAQTPLPGNGRPGWRAAALFLVATVLSVGAGLAINFATGSQESAGRFAQIAGLVLTVIGLAAPLLHWSTRREAVPGEEEPTEEAKAVSRLIEGVINGTHTRLGRTSRRDQALFFVAGLAASIPVQVVVDLVAR